MHVYSISVTYLPSIKRIYCKAVGGVDFTKYAQLTIIQYVYELKIG